MSHYVNYQAVPERSQFFQRLRNDARFRSIYELTAHRPCGPFEFFLHLTVDEINESVLDLAEKYKVVSIAEARRWVDDFQTELFAMEREWPGIQHRKAYFQGREEFDDDLRESLIALQVPSKRIQWWQVGVAPLTADSSSDLYWLPAEEVHHAAEVLRHLNDPQLDLHPEFQDFRRVYGVAAEHHEAMIVAWG